jgi:hypothetical protein
MNLLLPERPARTRERERDDEPRPRWTRFSEVEFPEYGLRQIIMTSNDRLHVERRYDHGRVVSFRFGVDQLEPLEVALDYAGSSEVVR